MQKLILTLLTFNATHGVKPIALNLAKKAVQEYHATGKFEKEIQKKANKAWKIFKKIPVENNATIVVDCDDTLVSSFEANAKWGFGNLLAIDKDWAQNGNFPAIEPIKELYNKLIDKGFKIIILSNRPLDCLEATKKNLAQQGYTGYEKLIIRSTNSIANSQAFKNKTRKELVDQGYNIVGCIGDQETDLAGENTGVKIKLPNYLYQV